jgi:hypothetical protein
VGWDGPRPAFVTEHPVEFRKPGQDGISAQLQGVNGDPFQVQLTAVFPNEAQCRTAEHGYRDLIGAAPQVLVYENVNYSVVYNHRYFVHGVQIVSAKRMPRLIGPTWDYLGGWQLISAWTLIPVAT